MTRLLLVSFLIAATTAPVPQAAPLQKKPVKGTCDAFNLHRETLGIIDGNGLPHPGLAGWTTTTVTYAYTSRYTTRRVRGRIRLTANVKATFTGTAKPARLDWIPSYPLSPACQIEKRRWEREVEEHEGRHVRDFHEIMKTAGARFKNGWTLVVEGATEVAARAELDRRVKAALSAEARRVVEAGAKAAEAFHRTPQGRPIGDIDCRTCAGRP